MNCCLLHLFLSLQLLAHIGLALPLPQVNQEIDNLEDLLALESSNPIRNEVLNDRARQQQQQQQRQQQQSRQLQQQHQQQQLVPIAPAPKGFGGERLSSSQGQQQHRQQNNQQQNVQSSGAVNPDGSYSFGYTSEDSSRQESGRPNPEGGHTSVGSYSYRGPDGVTYTVNYEAGVGGYRPTGAHIPTQRWEDAKAGRSQIFNNNNNNNRQQGGQQQQQQNLFPSSSFRSGKDLSEFDNEEVEVLPAEEVVEEVAGAERIQFRKTLPDEGVRIKFRPN